MDKKELVIYYTWLNNVLLSMANNLDNIGDEHINVQEKCFNHIKDMEKEMNKVFSEIIE